MRSSVQSKVASFSKSSCQRAGVLVAGEDHIEIAFFVVALVNQVKEQPGILLVKGTVANLVNNQARGGTRSLRQESVFPERLAAVNRSWSSDTLIAITVLLFHRYFFPLGCCTFRLTGFKRASAVTLSFPTRCG